MSRWLAWSTPSDTAWTYGPSRCEPSGGPFDVRSESAAADAAAKLMGSGVMSRRLLLARMGLSQDQIEREMAEINSDAQNARDITMGRYVAGLQDR